MTSLPNPWRRAKSCASTPGETRDSCPLRPFQRYVSLSRLSGLSARFERPPRPRDEECISGGTAVAGSASST